MIPLLYQDAFHRRETTACKEDCRHNYISGYYVGLVGLYSKRSKRSFFLSQPLRRLGHRAPTQLQNFGSTVHQTHSLCEEWEHDLPVGFGEC